MKILIRITEINYIKYLLNGSVCVCVCVCVYTHNITYILSIYLNKNRL